MPASESVSYRLPKEFESLFEAAMKKDESKGECTKRLVISALSGIDEEKPNVAIEELRIELQKVRRDVRSLARALLFRTSRKTDDKAALAEADAWLESIFGKE